MAKLSFSEMPVVVRGACVATGFMAWVLFAELIIDRHGWDSFLPYYRVGNICVYDVGVLAILTIVYLALSRGGAK